MAEIIIIKMISKATQRYKIDNVTINEYLRIYINDS